MTLPVVLVRWRDSLTGVGGWHAIGEAETHAQEAWDKPLSAAGFLVAETDHYVVLATGYNPVSEGEAEVTGTLMIPRSEVVSLHRLTD